MKDLSKPGDARRRGEARQAAEARLQHLLTYQYENREQLRRQGAADASVMAGDFIFGALD